MNQFVPPPHSTEAEQALLGGLLLDNSSFEKVQGLSVNHFYYPEHQLIFTQLKHDSEAKRSFDVLTVSDKMRLNGTLDQIGGEAYLFKLAKNTASTSNIVEYSRIMKKSSWFL